MAKVTIEIDTNEKTVATNIDGKAVADVTYISVWTEDKEADYPRSFGLTIESCNDEGDLCSRTTLTAAQESAKASIGDVVFNGFTAETKNNLTDQLSALLLRKPIK